MPTPSSTLPNKTSATPTIVLLLGSMRPNATAPRSVKGESYFVAVRSRETAGQSCPVPGRGVGDCFRVAMSDGPTIDWSELQRHVRHAAAEAGEGAANARLRRDAVAQRLAELRAARGGESGPVGETGMRAESARQTA